MVDMGMDQLDDRARDTLDVDCSWWKYAGANETTVRERFGESATRSYQRLNTLIDHPAAMAHDPMTARRPQRLRDTRRRQSSASRAVSLTCSMCAPLHIWAHRTSPWLPRTNAPTPL